MPFTCPFRKEKKGTKKQKKGRKRKKRSKKVMNKVVGIGS